MTKIKTIEERVGECMHVHGNGYFVPREGYSDIITKDRQSIREALREGLEELPIYMYGTPKQNGVIDMQQTIEKNKALALVDELLGGEFAKFATERIQMTGYERDQALPTEDNK